MLVIGTPRGALFGFVDEGYDSSVLRNEGEPPRGGATNTERNC